MKKYRLIIQPPAFEDLDAAYEWIRERAAGAAARWFHGFVDALNSLTESPERCGLAPRTMRSSPKSANSSTGAAAVSTGRSLPSPAAMFASCTSVTPPERRSPRKILPRTFSSPSAEILLFRHPGAAAPPRLDFLFLKPVLFESALAPRPSKLFRVRQFSWGRQGRRWLVRPAVRSPIIPIWEPARSSWKTMYVYGVGELGTYLEGLGVHNGVAVFRFLSTAVGSRSETIGKGNGELYTFRCNM